MTDKSTWHRFSGYQLKPICAHGTKTEAIKYQMFLNANRSATGIRFHLNDCFPHEVRLIEQAGSSRSKLPRLRDLIAYGERS